MEGRRATKEGAGGGVDCPYNRVSSTGEGSDISLLAALFQSFAF